MIFGFLEMPGGGEMLLIALFIVIFFGAKKIPEVMRGFGKGIREFKDASKGIHEEIQKGIDAVNEDPKRLTNS